MANTEFVGSKNCNTASVSLTLHLYYDLGHGCHAATFTSAPPPSFTVYPSLPVTTQSRLSHHRQSLLLILGIGGVKTHGLEPIFPFHVSPLVPRFLIPDSCSCILIPTSSFLPLASCCLLPLASFPSHCACQHQLALSLSLALALRSHHLSLALALASSNQIPACASSILVISPLTSPGETPCQSITRSRIPSSNHK